MSNLVTTAFDRMRAQEVVTPLVTMPAPYPFGPMSIAITGDIDHPDMEFRDQNGVARVVVHGTAANVLTEPALQVPTFATQVSPFPLGRSVAFDTANNFVPLTFPDLAAELSGIAVNQTVECLGYQSATPGVSTPLAITDADFASTNTYTCAGQNAAATVQGIAGTATPVPLFTLVGTPDTSYTITVTSSVRILDAVLGLIEGGGNVTTMSWNYADLAAVSFETHTSVAAASVLTGADVGATGTLVGTLTVTPTLAPVPGTVIVGFKVDVVRVPASIPV